MIFQNDRAQLRQIYFQSWNKHKLKQPLEPLERLIAELILQHPEYHAFFDDAKKNQHQEFSPEQGQSNPFLHLGMHIAIHEQITTQRPQGIDRLYQSLISKLGDAHTAEHKMMDCLGAMLWQAQRNNSTPNETTYLECIKKLL